MDAYCVDLRVNTNTSERKPHFSSGLPIRSHSTKDNNIYPCLASVLDSKSRNDSIMGLLSAGEQSWMVLVDCSIVDYPRTHPNLEGMYKYNKFGRVVRPYSYMDSVLERMRFFFARRTISILWPLNSESGDQVRQ